MKKERDLGHARIDYDREARCGVPEVIFAPGKTVEQIVAILRGMAKDKRNAWASRVSPEQAEAIIREIPAAKYHATSRMLTLDIVPPKAHRKSKISNLKSKINKAGIVAVLCAGTSDVAVAEEAAFTVERIGFTTLREYDVGVAGLHRLLGRLPAIRKADVIIVVAGMEGALPSVVAGLVRVPVIAVPVSVGYGIGAGGFAALAGMLTSCSPGISVVNIDNGFGAGVCAAKMLFRRNATYHGRKR